MPLINCEINFFSLLCRKHYSDWNWWKSRTKFAITDTKLYASVVTFLAQDNAKLLQLLKTAFKRTIN